MSKGVPIRIADDEQRYVFRIRITEDLVRLGFYHVAVGEYQLLPVECFLAW